MTLRAAAPRLAILKADDLGFAAGLDTFRRLAEIAWRHRISLSMGTVASRLATMPAVDLAYLRGLLADPAFELWNHSLDHQDMTRLGADAQRRDIITAQRIIEDRLGLRPNVFGAPYNLYDATLIDVLQACAAFAVIYLPQAELEPAMRGRFGVIGLHSMISPEFVRETDRQCSFDAFMLRWRQRSELPLLTIQVHPPAWNATSFAVIEQCIVFLLGNGYQFVTAAEAAAWARGAAEDDQRRSVDAAQPVNLRLLALQRAAGQALPAADFGAGRAHRALLRLGWHAAPAGQAHRVAGFGAAALDWAAAYAALHPAASITVIEPDATRRETARAALRRLSQAEIAFCAPEELAQRPAAAGFSRLWVTASAPSMDLERLLDLAHAWLVMAGRCYLVLPSQAGCLADALAALARDDPRSARAALAPLLFGEAYRLGWPGPAGARHAHRHQDIIRAIMHCGFKMVVDTVAAEDGFAGEGAAAHRASMAIERSLPLLPQLGRQLETAAPPARATLLGHLLHTPAPGKLLMLDAAGLLAPAPGAPADLGLRARLKAGRISTPAEIAAGRAAATAPLTAALFCCAAADFDTAAELLAGQDDADATFLRCLALYLHGREAGKLQYALLLGQAAHPRDHRIAALVAAEAAAAAEQTGQVRAAVITMLQSFAARPGGESASRHGGIA